MKFKVVGSLFLAACIFTLGTSAAFAESLPSQMTLNAGDLKLTNTFAPLDSVKIVYNESTGLKTQSSSNTNRIKVEDSRGSAGGWNVTAKITDFVSSNILDPSSGGKGRYIVTFAPIDVDTSFNLLTHDSMNPVNVRYSRTSITNTEKTILSADAGYGMGVYEFIVNQTVKLPFTGTVKTLSGTGSRYQVGDQIGLAATSYSATISINLIAGI